MRHQSPAARSGAMFETARELRRRSTPAEVALWEMVRAGRLGPRFRRQHVIEAFVVDFCCTARSLVVEVDGGVHESPEAVADDAWRTERLTELGFRVMRFTNDAVLQEPDRVVAEISDALAR